MINMIAYYSITLRWIISILVTVIIVYVGMKGHN